MKTVTRPPTHRMSADERREEILDAAMAEFALKGLHGTSTETIAQRVGISQPYLFRLFGTKKGLFLAAVERGFGRVQEMFRVAAEGNPEDALNAMGAAYADLLSHREQLLLQLQAYAACGDPEVREKVQREFADLFQNVERLSRASEPEVQDFFAQGMLLTIAATMDLPAAMGAEGWVQRCLAPKQ